MVDVCVVSGCHSMVVLVAVMVMMYRPHFPSFVPVRVTGVSCVRREEKGNLPKLEEKGLFECSYINGKK